MKTISVRSRLMLLSVLFTMSLIAVRFIYSGNHMYAFYAWNTFLAAIPYMISTQVIKLKKWNGVSSSLLVVWLLFFPNAPYMITDLFHYEERPDAPFWYDLLIVISSAWNGLILGLASLMNIELFLARYLKKIWVTIAVFFSLLLGSYGVFLGRYLRFNSWDILTEAKELAYTSAHHLFMPQHYPKLWVFTLLFTVLLSIIYFTLKYLPHMAEKK